MKEETVDTVATEEPQQDNLEQVVEEAQENAEQQEQESNHEQESHEEDKKVPLSALQKERRKRQELEIRAQILEEQAQRQANQYQNVQQQDEEDDYDSVTKAEYKRDRNLTKQEIIREVQESSWREQNPDKYEIVNEKLELFLKKRPNLAYAIASSTNRYKEAWDLMNALENRPTKKVAPREPVKQAPGNPTAVPKAAGINQTMDIMRMSDQEFREWRQTQRRRR